MNNLESYLNQIITGDCRELAKELPDKCARLAFCDPPYWVGFQYGETNDREMEYVEPHWLVSEMLRAAEVVMITPGVGQMHDYPKPYWTINWYKPAAMGRNVSGGVNSWEPILVYGKTRIDIDVIVVTVVGQPDAAFHSCPKPLKLLSKIIATYTGAGELVIDFMAGSGTTCKAAKQLQRNWIGFEIDAEIARQANERVRLAQPPLFVPSETQMELIP